ncbi:MAG: hypothetical protein AB8B62_00190 [Roseobacter sp.]
MKKFWWAKTYRPGRLATSIEPHLPGVSIEDTRYELMGELNHRLAISRRPLDEDTTPSELRWMLKTVPEKKRALPDAFKGHMDSIIISEAFETLLEGFDLGTSQIIELPLYDIKAKDKVGRTDVDTSKKDPRCWFLFHVTESKDAFLPERSVGIRELQGWDKPMYAADTAVPPEIAVDQEAAASGPDVWRDPKLMDVVFFSDGFKRAIKSAKLKTPAFPFKPCVLD